MQCFTAKSCFQRALPAHRHQPALPPAPAASRLHRSKRHFRNVTLNSTEEGQPSTSAPTTSSMDASAGLDVDSVTAKKQAEAERLRAAEKFMVVGGGNATCKSCGYNYSADKGDPDFPVARGTKFVELPQDYVCPVCGASKNQFESDARVLAGFAENQKYGLGFNSVTGNQKLLVIYGLLGIGFLLLIGGYALE